MTARRHLLLAVAALGCGAPGAETVPRRAPVAAGPHAPLERMTMADALASGTAGAGCTWSDGRGQGWQMSMADDRAAVRLRGRLVLLAPAAGAADLGPFTYDRWQAGSLRIGIRPTGRATARGGALVRPALLLLRDHGRSEVLAGTLDCGS